MKPPPPPPPLRSQLLPFSDEQGRGIQLPLLSCPSSVFVLLLLLSSFLSAFVPHCSTFLHPICCLLQQCERDPKKMNGIPEKTNQYNTQFPREKHYKESSSRRDR